MGEAASEAARERLLNALVGDNASEASRQSFRQRIIDNHMNDTEVEIEYIEHGGVLHYVLGNLARS